MTDATATAADAGAEMLLRVARVYEGRDGEATRALYAELAALGGTGDVAVNLLRAQKNSARAKEYRRASARRAAYETKDWAIGELAAALARHAAACGLAWGWAEDPEQPFHRAVLYVDLPTGQVSFHTAARSEGPAYAGSWDGWRNVSGARILRWTARLLAAREAPADG